MPNWRENPAAADYIDHIDTTAQQHKLPENLLGSLLQQESQFNPDAKSPAGAEGIAQIVPKWHPDAKPGDANASITYAAGYLQKLYGQYGDWNKALAAYNWGPGNLSAAIKAHGDKWLEHAPEETRHYVGLLAPSDEPRATEVGVQEGAPYVNNVRTEVPNSAVPVWEPEQAYSFNPQFSQRDEKAAETPSADDPDWFDQLGTAFHTDNATVRAFDWLTEKNGFKHDPEFNFEAFVAEQKERLAVLPPEAVEGLEGALNSEHAEFLMQKTEKQWADEQTVQSVTARILAAVVDPIDIGASALGGAAGAAYKLGRVGRAVTGGVAAASGAVAAESLLAQTSPFRDSKDVLFAGITAFALGAPLGALGRSDIDMDALAREAARAVRETPDGKVAEGGAGLFNKFERVKLAPGSEKRLDELTDDDVPELVVNTKLPTYSNTLHGSDDADVRDIAFKILETGVPIKGTKQFKAKGFTAEGRANSIHRSQAVQMYRSVDREFKSWAQERGYGTLRRTFGHKAGGEFREEVGRAIKGEPGVSPQAVAAAADVRKVLDDQLSLMQAAGVKGADGVEPNPKYLPRVHHPANWRGAVDEFGDEGLERLFREAFQRADDEMPLDLAQKLAKGYVKSVTRHQFNIDVGVVHGIPTDDFEALRHWFDPEEADEIIEALEAFNRSKEGTTGKIKNLKRRATFDENVALPMLTRNGDTKLLRISDLMENDIGKVVDRYLRVTSGWVGLAKEAGITSRDDVTKVLNGIRSKGVERPKAEIEANRMDEVIKLVTGQHLENDPYSLGVQVGRSVRAYNFARVGGGFGWAQLAEIGNIMGHSTMKHFMSAMPEMRKMFKHAENGELADELAAELDFALGAGTDFVRNPAISGFDEFGLGFDATSAIGKGLHKADGVLQSAGRVTAALSGMAPVNAWLQRVATRSSAYRLGELAQKHGTASKVPANVRARFADMGWSTSDVNKIFKAINEHASWGDSTRTSDVFGEKLQVREPGVKLDSLKVDDNAVDISKVESLRQSIRAGEDVPQILVRKGEDGSLTVVDGHHRLEAMKREGLATADVYRVATQGEFTAAKSKKLAALNFDKWPPEVFDSWRMGMHRQFRRVVQENDVGNSFPFMHRELGKIFTQFQSFMINAVNKQTIHGLYFRDTEMFTAWSMSMFAGSLAYVAQNSLNYAADPKELKKRMSLKRLGAAAFMRAGWASILPQVVDTGLGLAGQDKLFGHARSSGLGTGPLEGNPTYSLVRDFGNVLKLPGKLLLDDDYNFSQTDVKRLQRSAAFGNVTGVRNAFKLLSEGLPSRSD